MGSISNNCITIYVAFIFQVESIDKGLELFDFPSYVNYCINAGIFGAHDTGCKKREVETKEVGENC